MARENYDPKLDPFSPENRKRTTFTLVVVLGAAALVLAATCAFISMIDEGKSYNPNIRSQPATSTDFEPVVELENETPTAGTTPTLAA